MLVFETGQQGMGDGPGGKFPDRLELVVEAAIRIVLLAQLPADDFPVADLGAGAVAIAEDIEGSIQIGEPVVDRQEIRDVPLVRECQTL
jgi:hypothetical protein